MGVAGVGKTTVGQSLAHELGWRFVDADDFHSAANVAKMRAGIPLTDDDRAPWLQALHDAVRTWVAGSENVVLACSALKASYREQLAVSTSVKLVYLRAPEAIVAERLAERRHAYMNPQLLHSQFETLEEPANAVVVDATKTPEQIVATIRSQLQV